MADSTLATGAAGRPAVSDFVLAGGGEMGALMRSMDWSATALGAPETWPAALCSSVSTCLNCAFPILIWWGPELVMLYNDEYRTLLGPQKHPAAMGRPGTEVWPEIWDVIGPMLEGVMMRRAPARARDLLLFVERYGYTEETYFSFSYSPIIDEGGAVGGVFCPVIETTQKVIADRRLHTLRELAALPRAEQVGDVCADIAQVLARATHDIPFTLIYLREPDGRARLCAAAGIDTQHPAAPEFIDLQHEAPHVWPLHRIAHGARSLLADDLQQRFGALPCGAWNDPPRRALLAPIVLPGHDDPFAFLITSVSPRRELDADYTTFFRLIADQMTSALADVKAFEEERRRVQALAELDHAKTVFFSNISHELRTPLTLLLGPLEQVLAAPDDQLPAQRRDLEVAQRNAMRMLKLVNNLLDFARIEAGRMTATYEPVDLGAFTAELASVFRSATQQAGVALTIDRATASLVGYVDRDMWEKIVLNLLSNAFKHTFQGEIRVSLEEDDQWLTLRVADTGTGIPAEALPKLFDRFYRVPDARGRTHEGSGIGLSLVGELVKLHGGEITAASRLNEGSTFTVRIPRGSRHLPPNDVRHEVHSAPSPRRAHQYADEALRWLPETEAGRMRAGAVPLWEPATPLPDAVRTASGVVLVADDNADMRDYVRRLLSQRFKIVTARDGVEALCVLSKEPVDLVLTDVMMPNVDGFTLVRAIRSDPRIAHTPVIMLSARAGEEARIAGLDVGADDYLVKPFSARELIARVSAQITIARFRRQLRAAEHDAEAARREALEERNQRLQAQSEKLRELFDRTPGFMAVLRGPQLVFELANPAYHELTGRKDLIGRRLLEVLPEMAEQQFPGLLQQVLTTGRPVTGKGVEVRLLRQGAQLESRYVDFVYQPLAGSSGEVSGVFVEGFDVTERIIAERSLQQANRRKDEFLATLAHELRNPLAALAAASQLLAKASQRPETAALAREALQRQIRHMARLLDDLLDVSRITHGMIQLRKELLDAREVITTAVETARPAFEAKGHQLTLELGDAPLFVHADRVRLSQILSNLLTNAAKYTDPNGRVRLHVSHEDGAAVVRVVDNGIGIDRETLPTIFEMFSQARPALERSEGGLGIGLSLVRGLVQLHGGEVSAHSEGLGRGSEFTVRLPLAVAPPPSVERPSTAAEAPPVAPMKILIADDNEDSAASWAVLLEMSGHIVRTARDGAAALQLAREFQPDIALLDIGMPGMNGYELARCIRREPWGCATTLLAITGWGHEQDKQQARSAGFDHHFTKPLDIKAIEPLLAAERPRAN